MPGPTRAPTLADVAAVGRGVAVDGLAGVLGQQARLRTRPASGCWPRPPTLGYAGPNPLGQQPAARAQRRRRHRGGPAQHRVPRPRGAPDARRGLRGPRRAQVSACCSWATTTSTPRLPIDAAIYDICGRDTWSAYDDLVARDVPVVVVEGPAWPGATYVDIEHRRGAAAVARHLHDLGHRRVATVTLARLPRPARARGRARATSSRTPTSSAPARATWARPRRSSPATSRSDRTSPRSCARATSRRPASSSRRGDRGCGCPTTSASRASTA